MQAYSWLQIDQYSSWNVSRVIRLIKEDIFSISTLSRKVLEVSILADAVFLAQLLPELTAD